MSFKKKASVVEAVTFALICTCAASCSSSPSAQKEVANPTEAAIVSMPPAPKLDAPEKEDVDSRQAVVPVKTQVKKSVSSPEEPGKTISALAGSTLQINGDSSLRKYSSNATQLAIQIKVEPAPKDPADLVKDKLSEFILDIPIAGMKSGTGLLDEHLQDALNSKKYTDIRGTVKGYEIKGKDADGTYRVTANVELSIAGTTRTVPIDAVISIEGNHIRIKGEKQLLMTDFKIVPPTLMFGTIKTADAISIRFNLLLGMV
jgi:hypothetical protein